MRRDNVNDGKMESAAEVGQTAIVSIISEAMGPVGPDTKASWNRGSGVDWKHLATTRAFWCLSLTSQSLHLSPDHQFPHVPTLLSPASALPTVPGLLRTSKKY